MMSEPEFWRIIDASREAARANLEKDEGDFVDRHTLAIGRALLSLKPEEIEAFDARMHELYARAYRWDLWAAAHLLGGGCGDDGFMDFRYCLVSLGRDLYTRSLADPDVLAETIGRSDMPYMQAEAFQYVAKDVYFHVTGRELPGSDPPFVHPDKPAGEDFDFDDRDQMRKRFPRITKGLAEEGESP